MWIALEKFTRLHEAEYFQDMDAVTRWAQDFPRLYCDIMVCQMVKRGHLNWTHDGGNLGDQIWMKGDLVGLNVIDAWAFDRYAVGYR